MKSVQTLFPVYAGQLPEGWKWARIHFVFGDGASAHFTEYGYSEDHSIVENDFKAGAVRVQPLFYELRNEIAPPPLACIIHEACATDSDSRWS